MAVVRGPYFGKFIVGEKEWNQFKSMVQDAWPRPLKFTRDFPDQVFIDAVDPVTNVVLKTARQSFEDALRSFGYNTIIDRDFEIHALVSGYRS